MTPEDSKMRAIEALKFVKVDLKKGHLTDISIAMLIVEMERRGAFAVSNGERNSG